MSRDIVRTFDCRTQAAARFQLSLAVRIKLRNTLRPLSSNDLLSGRLSLKTPEIERADTHGFLFRGDGYVVLQVRPC